MEAIMEAMEALQRKDSMLQDLQRRLMLRDHLTVKVRVTDTCKKKRLKLPKFQI